VEINQVAVELAKSNAQRNNLSVSFFCAPAEKLAPELLSSFQPDALVINPPKTGIDPSLLHALSIDSSLHTILYISCNPTTLARDLALLVTRGFLIRSLQCFDMFPQTTHVETVVCLQKNTPVFMIS
jgi:23S rRNA (uracil1939-C5)-methyltransferase